MNIKKHYTKYEFLKRYYLRRLRINSDKFLDYMDYLVENYGRKFCACFGLYLLIIVLIDIIK